MMVIVDYGMGNLGSILNMLRKVGAPAIISGKPEDAATASHLILPGVGAFDQGMSQLAQCGLLPVLNQQVLEKRTPLLGICLGAQLLCKQSEEGRLPGLGWIDAKVIRFNPEAGNPPLKIPHMGWNEVKPVKPSLLFKNMPDPARFYFVHSYHILCSNPQEVMAQTSYGADFSSAVEKDNIMGVQFHPEKSHKFGMCLMRNFAALN